MEVFHSDMRDKIFAVQQPKSVYDKRICLKMWFEAAFLKMWVMTRSLMDPESDRWQGKCSEPYRNQNGTACVHLIASR